MDKETFLKEVRAEIEHLKANATNDEKARLDFNTFEHNSITHCIYGQMTGDCDSKRALELFPKKYKHLSIGGLNAISFEDQSFVEGFTYTALEKFLYMINDEERKQILEYLKGEIQILDLEL